MNSTFYRLLDNTMQEVCLREPAYTASFPITVSVPKMISSYGQHAENAKVPLQELERALVDGLAYVATGWKTAAQASAWDDPIARFLCNCIVDAFYADQGLLALQSHNGLNGSLADTISQKYIEKKTSTGLRYYVRSLGTHPLLLVNATGTPISIWKRFLSDPTHEFRIILPERRGSDLFNGGLQQHVDIQTESADFASILDSESFERADVLAWCNGARVAIDLANSRAHQIASMVLLGPMLKGIRGIAANPSKFERDLQPLLDAVTKESSLAPFLAHTISKQSASPDWNRLANAPIARAQVLFSLPARDNASGMIAQLTEPQSFINIARRVASDESYPMNEALKKLETRTMVVMGSDDSIVSNELVLSAMKQLCRNPVMKVVLGGSGHYIQDLQYHYFRWLLTEFLVNHQPPRRTARISIENQDYS